MIEYNDCMLYLQDLIQFQHNDFGLTYGKILQFFKLVSLLTYVQNPMLSLQEDVVEPQVTVECLLTLDQFVCVNQHVNILYCVCVCVAAKNTAVCCLTARKSPRNSSLPLGLAIYILRKMPRKPDESSVECYGHGF